jgi:colanic acid biosynthesis glycosyl transferase WcaI
MRILIVSQYYSPEPVPIPGALAAELSARGHQVRVLTAFPNYPSGRIAEGYRQRWNHRERIAGVPVRRVPVFLSHSRNPLARLANYASFGVSSVLASSYARGADVVYVYATQMTAAIGPSWWRRLSGTPYVLHVQDLWPESVTGSSMVRRGLPARVIDAVLTPWLRGIYRRAAGIVAIGPGMARLLVERGASAGRVHSVFNWAPTVDAAPRRDPDATTGLTVMYAGNVGEMQDLETVMRAMHLVRDLEGLRLVVVGSGVALDGVRRLAAQLDLDNVEFSGRIEQADMGPVYAGSDFQLVTLIDLPIFRVTVPSKLQSSLAGGIPVITTVAGDVSDLVDEHGLGLTSPPGDAEGLAETLRRAFAVTTTERTAMGARAREYYEQTMSLHSGVDRIEQILADAASEENGN